MTGDADGQGDGPQQLSRDLSLDGSAQGGGPGEGDRGGGRGRPTPKATPHRKVATGPATTAGAALKKASAIPKAAGALAVRPGYEVGYAKPPEASRFKPGQSGNPRGRPKGAKNRLPALNEERMKTIIIEEAYRTITVRDGLRNVSVPIARAVLRSLAVNAVKGQHRSQRLFAELLSAVETSNRVLHDEWFKTVIDYKASWDEELQRRRVLGITNLPDPLPHPDHIHIDMNRGTVRVVGPMTREQKQKWDHLLARKTEFEAEGEEIERLLQTETAPGIRALLQDELKDARRIVDMIERAERGELTRDGR